MYCIISRVGRVNHNNPGESWSVVLGMHRLYQDGVRYFLSRVYVHEDYRFGYVTYGKYCRVCIIIAGISYKLYIERRH